MSSIFPLRETVTLDDEREPRLVEIDEDTADEVFEALSSSTTREIFLELHKAPQTASDLAEVTETSVQNVQYHLTKLLDAELIEVVDTWYSERGSEMKVYAPQDESLVLFAGRDKQRSLRSLLSRVVGVLGMLVPASVMAAWLTGRNAVEGLFGGGESTDGGAMTGGDDSPTSEEPSTTTDEEKVDEGTTTERETTGDGDAGGGDANGGDANGGDSGTGDGGMDADANGGDDMATDDANGDGGGDAADPETTDFQGTEQGYEVSFNASTDEINRTDGTFTDGNGTVAEFECSDVTVTDGNGTVAEFECSDVTVATDGGEPTTVTEVTTRSNETASSAVDGSQATPRSFDGATEAADAAASIDPALAAGIAFFLGGLFVFTAIAMWYGTPDSW